MGAGSTIVWLTVRQLLALRRGIAVLLFAVLPALIAALFHLRAAGDPVPFFIAMQEEFLIRVVVPVVALVFGTGAFGAEMEEGTAIYLLTRPVERWRIVLMKLLTAIVLAALVTGAAALLTGVILFSGTGPHGLTTGFAVAAVIGSTVYCCIFVALGLHMRRALIAGLIYVLLWEGFAADTFAGTRLLSVRQYVLSIADRLTDAAPELFSAPLDPATAVRMSVIVLVVATLLAVNRLRSFELTDQR